MQPKNHWEKIYTDKTANEVSWFQEHDTLSLALIEEAKIPLTASIIDVGGGASTLVDDLLVKGYRNLSVLDISGAALVTAKTRLGAHANKVKWIEGNLLDINLPKSAYDLWHDRAVFHFLTNVDERHTYVEKVLHSVKPGGLVMVATFSEDGPTQCSGLPVMRYSPDELHAEFGNPFTLLHHETESHKTPTGNVQEFVYCLCRKA